MNISSFVSAFFVGIVISLPLGPVALLIVQRSVKSGFFSGFTTGFGSSNGDLIYSLTAGFGVLLISDFVHNHEVLLALIGAIFISIFGYKIMTDISDKDLHLPGHKNYFLDYTSGFALALINPAIVLVYSAVFLNMGQVTNLSHTHFVLQVVVGLFLGANLWWTLLSYGMSRIKHKINHSVLTKINKFSGILMFSLAVFIIIRAIFR